MASTLEGVDSKELMDAAFFFLYFVILEVKNLLRGKYCYVKNNSLVIDTGDEDADESESSDSESNETLDLSKITEMRLVPSDPNQLDALFEVFSECAELNPEPVEEEEEEHNWVFSADQTGLEMGLGMNTLMGYGYSLIHPGGGKFDLLLIKMAIHFF
ncbi:putative PH-like domain superfamily protein [Helianthus annuus]|nr:putative PH-like domain superfamily protein [Helianthus annuus]KAJ0722294.1 putative PH-like domain superfamily protein [Helianthus annuus]